MECHGTATALGDPLEIQALTRAFRRGTPRARDPARSARSNPTSATSNSAPGWPASSRRRSRLKHGVIPPSLHFDTPNPRIPLERSPFFVNTALRPFDDGPGPRRAGRELGRAWAGRTHSSSWRPPRRRSARSRNTRRALILNVSAHTEDALAAQLARLRNALTSPDAPEASDTCFTVNRGRHHFGHRVSIVGRDRDELRADARPDPRRAAGAGRAPAAREPITFLFSGQGAQYARMGEAIYRAEPSFKETLEQCFALFAAADIPRRRRSLRGRRRRPPSHAVCPARPLLAAGRPDRALAPVGHRPRRGDRTQHRRVRGRGDGRRLLSPGRGDRLVAARARLMEELRERGGMVSVGADLDTVQSAWPATGETIWPSPP